MKKDWYSWPNGQSNGFRRRILALVESEDRWRVPLGNFLVLEYSWQEGSTTQQFKPGKTYTNRSFTSEMRKLASPVARGKSLTSRDIYFEVASAVPEMDRALNPFHGPTGVRQAVTIKAAANKSTVLMRRATYVRETVSFCGST
ncbi:hypothetical protein RvY_10313 [Ramazzottius varieornatus]|uniref:Uncharacterized protein n=1 Tax=Ramazzottius varieornatus TaxID=947166 RepID=A0A1D1VHQ6_RAMVA|nr:hypothetical protein RvY_10313 [Ramazzottius varieornatus]